MPELYITGVEKNNNKIFVTAGLAATMQSLGYSTGVYKPVETGIISDKSKDLSIIKFSDPFINTYFSYRLEKDMSPILSAAAEGLVIEKDVILKDYQKIQDIDECLITDGLSGLGTPLGKDFLEEDILKMLDTPLVFVVSARNPDIGNTLLSVNRVRELGIKLIGVILNDCMGISSNEKLMPKLIEEYTDTKILGALPFFEKSFNPEDLIASVINNIDVESVFRLKIAKLNIGENYG